MSGSANTPETPPAVLKGAALIADEVSRLPEKPGVYRMIGEDKAVLYVGKARNLKARVSSYTKPESQSNRIARMIAETREMEFVVTVSETESLLLEANLIKQLKPRFNVLMRDDKSFPYILIDTSHEIPQLTKHRGAQKKKGHYFGPFAYAGAVNRTLNTLQKAFLLRSCADSIYENRARPCLLYEIKRCAAPCVNLIDKEDYLALVEEAKAFLAGKNRDIQERLVKQMEAAAEARDYERAAGFRDRIKALAAIQESQDINTSSFGDADIFAIHADGGQACIQTFFFRAGQNWGNHSFYPRHDNDIPMPEILDAFMAQFYDKREPPKLILTSEELPHRDLLAEALTLRTGRKVEILKPQRGDRKSITDQARMNAREALGRRLSETSSQQKLLKELGETLGMKAPPERIEVFDNSHISGTNALGCMVVADPQGFCKNQYRKFKIRDKNISPGDDYAMMREVLTRRYGRLIREENPGSPNWPSLIVIDGGAGQLSVARQAIEDCGLALGPDGEAGEIMLIALAKGRRENEQGQKRTDRTMGAVGEQVFIPDQPSFTLPPRSPVLYYLQRLRDEAHRFAIGAHRAARKKQAISNPLDEISGIGPRRKKALLHHFGSAKAVTRAKKQDLQTVEGISAAMAEKIYNHFHGE
jgi:excinuclease ABC subunit C